MNNKIMGMRFEEYVANYLANHGYWVHLLTADKNGQPADLIAVKAHVADLIDCKVCSGDGFPFSRIEDNQYYAMNKWYEGDNGPAYFALLVDGEVYMVSHRTMFNAMGSGKKSMSVKQIKMEGIPLGDWI